MANCKGRYYKQLRQYLLIAIYTQYIYPNYEINRAKSVRIGLHSRFIRQIVAISCYNVVFNFRNIVRISLMDVSLSLRRLRRRYREPLLKLFFHLFVRLPKFATYSIGVFIGWILWVSNGRSRKIAEKNIRACFPNVNAERHEEICKKSLVEMGRAMSELPRLWTASQDGLLSLIKRVEGLHHVENAMQSGKGIICLTPHLGAWEIMGLYMSIKYPMTTLYRPPTLVSLEEIMVAGRTRFGVNLVPTDVQGVRGLLKALKKGEMLGILPDQDPGASGGEFAPFFGIQANTITLVSRLVKKTDAATIVCFAERLPKEQGYVLHIQEPLKGVGSMNMEESLTELNRGIEDYIRQYPEQYQWSYRRFKTRPKGEASFY